MTAVLPVLAFFTLRNRTEPSSLSTTDIISGKSHKFSFRHQSVLPLIIVLQSLAVSSPLCIVELSRLTRVDEAVKDTTIRGATQNFREFEYTAQTVSTTNLRR